MRIDDIIKGVETQRREFVRRNLPLGICVLGEIAWRVVRSELQDNRVQYVASADGLKVYIRGLRCISSYDVPDDFVGVYGDAR